MPLSDREKVLEIVEILKKRFTNLSAVELVNLSWSILDAIKDK